MEIIYFTSLPQVTQLIVAQVGSSCGEPSVWQMSIIIGLVAASGIAFVTAGIGLAGIATTLVGLIMAGASLDFMAAALVTGTGLGTQATAGAGTGAAAHFTLLSHSIETLAGLIAAIRGILGC